MLAMFMLYQLLPDNYDFRIAEIDSQTVGGCTLSKIHKEKQTLEMVKKKGRRRALTESDIDPILRIRLSKHVPLHSKQSVSNRSE